MAGLVFGFPFDTGACTISLSWQSTLTSLDRAAVKVRFQSPAVAGKYDTTFGAIATIVREERFVGLYKGITSPLVRGRLPACGADRGVAGQCARRNANEVGTLT